MSVKTSEWQLLKYTAQNGGEQKLELFDLRNDPGECHNAAADRPDIIRSLQSKLEAYISRAMAHDISRENWSNNRRRLNELHGTF